MRKQREHTNSQENQTFRNAVMLKAAQMLCLCFRIITNNETNKRNNRKCSHSSGSSQKCVEIRGIVAHRKFAKRRWVVSCRRNIANTYIATIEVEKPSRWNGTGAKEWTIVLRSCVQFNGAFSQFLFCALSILALWWNRRIYEMIGMKCASGWSNECTRLKYALLLLLRT